MSPTPTSPSPSRTTRSRFQRRWQKADFDTRRELILDTALQLLHQHDLKAVTMRRVASRLGVGAMTLYTYIENQDALHREMVRRGFQMLQASCQGGSTFGTGEGIERWRGGARAYLNFALQHPNLYKLMFDTPIGEQNLDLLHGGFQPLLDKVTEHLTHQGLTGEELAHRARAAAGRYWIALHGLASLAIAGRLVILEGTLDDLLDDLLPRVAPSA